MKKCLQDVIITELGDLNEVAIKEQITINAPGPSLHYSTQDSKLIRHTIAFSLNAIFCNYCRKDNGHKTKACKKKTSDEKKEKRKTSSLMPNCIVARDM
jgi:hypothetical protein